MGRPDSSRWSNPIAGLALQRANRSRWLAGWALAAGLLSGPLALLFFQRPAFLTPALHAMLIGRTSPGSGETFLLPILLVAFVVLTVVGTVPQATLGIARERERRSLEPLLLTRLSPAAILAGELVQVLLTPVLATLALLPVICLSFMIGSIPLVNLFAGVAALLLCHLFFANVSLSASCWCRRSGTALFLGYAAVLLMTVGTYLLWSLGHRPDGQDPWWAGAALALNTVLILLDAIIPGGAVFLGSVPVPQAAFGGVCYLALSLAAFTAGSLALRRR